MVGHIKQINQTYNNDVDVKNMMEGRREGDQLGFGVLIYYTV